jgi:hypothetical protein
VRRVVRVLVAVALVAGGPAALAAFTSTSSAANTVATAADWTAPSVSDTVIAKQTGYLAGSIKQGGGYYVYANVADSGNPASGISTVRTDVSAITTGQTAVTLTAGSYSVNGTSYNYRSGALTANGSLSGTKSYTITSTDNLAYAQLQTGYSVAVDNTAPTATAISTGNAGGGNQGLAETGDTITFTFSEQIDPQSILAGWTGASTNVTVEFADGGCLLFLCGNDTFSVLSLPLGTVDLNSAAYYGCSVIGIVCDKTPASFVNSPMVASANTVTITLGTRSGGSGSFNDVGSNSDIAWDSSATPYDAAGNAASGNSVTETDNDYEF